MATHKEMIRYSGEDAIEMIREHRNEWIDRLSSDEFLIHYLSEQFYRIEISTNKLSFIKRALTQLKVTPVDLAHYSKLILEMRQKGSLSISKNTEDFFRADIMKAIQNYL
ncbi:MAG: hypothetical protein DI539_17845 [Flavobacterium psychrophilum]|nr:MAG: hypothetical protein DI539_17845 [Flavobacterium psychrophilum]